MKTTLEEQAVVFIL